VLAIAREDAAPGCTETVFFLGGKPGDRWRRAREWLDAHGHDDKLSYARATVIRVLEETDLLTHLNQGVMSWQDFPAPQAGCPVHGHDARDHCHPAASKRTKLIVVGVAKTQGEVRALRGVQKLESPLSQPARGGQVDRANAVNRRRSRSSSGSPRTAKTEMPSSGCPSSDQACAIPETWPRSLSGVSRPPRTTSVIAAGNCSARSRSCS
jgi:hypothetical protein